MADRTVKTSLTQPCLTQPETLKTEHYVYGVEPLNGYDVWSLFEACALGDLERVTALLHRDPRLVNAQYWYQLPLHAAVRGGYTSIVRLLLEQGADPGQSRFTYDSWDKLLVCARERGFHEIETLLAGAMERRFNYSARFAPLKEALIARDLQAVEALIRSQPELVQESDTLGNTALHWAVLTRQWALLRRLVELGANVDAQRADGQTPLLVAVNGASDYWYRAQRGATHPSLRNAWVLVGSLLTLGAEYTLSVAAAAGDQERVEALLREDPDLARRLDSARVSPLTYAAREGHLHLIRLLLDHGADPNTPEDLAPNGLALFEASSHNHVAIAELLLERGANPNAGADSSGCCLTIGAVYHGARAKPLQRILLDHGAVTPPYAMNSRQLEVAVRERQPIVEHEEFLGCLMQRRNVQLLDLYLEMNPRALEQLDFWSAGPFSRSPVLLRKLLARGLNPNQTDWLGRTFLHAHAELGAPKLAAIMLDAGAEVDAVDANFYGTPLAAAVRGSAGSGRGSGHRQVIDLLLKRGADLDFPSDRLWATARSWATRLGVGLPT